MAGKSKQKGRGDKVTTTISNYEELLQYAEDLQARNSFKTVTIYEIGEPRKGAKTMTELLE